jgi:hypothetical protein
MAKHVPEPVLGSRAKQEIVPADLVQPTSKTIMSESSLHDTAERGRPVESLDWSRRRFGRRCLLALDRLNWGLDLSTIITRALKIYFKDFT